MISHLNLPYAWENCANPETCFKVAHLNVSSEELNSYPKSWVENLLPHHELEDNYIAVCDENGEYHNEDGPAMENSRGTKYWFVHGVTRNDNGPVIMNPPESYE